MFKIAQELSAQIREFLAIQKPVMATSNAGVYAAIFCPTTCQTNCQGTCKGNCTKNCSMKVK